MSLKSKKILGISLFAGDFLIFYFSLFSALLIRGMPVKQEFIKLQQPFFHIFLICTFFLFIMNFYEIFNIRKIVVVLRELIMFIILTSLIGSVYFYFQPQLNITPRAVLFLTIGIFAVFLSLWRYAIFRILGYKSFIKRLFFIGNTPELKEFLESENKIYEPIGIYTNETLQYNSTKKISVFKNISEIDSLAEKIDIVVIASHAKENKNLIRQVFNTLPLNMRYVDFITLYEEEKKKIPLNSLDDWWFLENIATPHGIMNDILTRTFEIILSSIGVLFTLILYPFLAILIKCDSKGSVLYKQERLGKNEKPFMIYKFRTMKNDAEKNGPVWSKPNDGRITRTGKFLRKLHLDELPQFYNILKGDISFVGPRPERPHFVKKLKQEIPYYDIRHIEKPGLTGWAQLCYPASSTTEEAKEKFGYELYYIKNRSFIFDLIIILKTIRTILPAHKTTQVL